MAVYGFYLPTTISHEEILTWALTADDGGGMSPDDIRMCMSLGYSQKNSNTTIGQCKGLRLSSPYSAVFLKIIFDVRLLCNGCGRI